MRITTKKYQLTTNVYVTLAMKNILKEFWWVWLVPVAIMLVPLVWPSGFWWCFSISLVLIVLYLLFWAIQFVGITQMEQAKVFFEKLSYEIDSRQILVKLNAKQGMPLGWDKVVKAQMTKKHFLLYLSKAQFIHLPFSVFRADTDIKFMENILKRKNLVKVQENKPPAAGPAIKKAPAKKQP